MSPCMDGVSRARAILLKRTFHRLRQIVPASIGGINFLTRPAGTFSLCERGMQRGPNFFSTPE